MAGLTALPIQHRPLAAILTMIAAYFLFSCIDVAAKWLAFAGLPILQLVFMRYFVHFVMSAGMIARNGIAINRFGANEFKLVCLRGLLLLGATVANFIALTYLSLTLTGTLMFFAPVLVCALSGPFLGERVGKWRWSAIILGFVGVVVAMRPFDASFHWAMPLSCVAPVCLAFYFLITRKLSGVVSGETLQLYGALVGCVVILPFAVVEWTSPETGRDWLIMIAMGFSGWLGHEFLIRAYRLADASTLSPFMYTLIIFMAGWSYFIFGNVPDQWTLLGAAIISGAGVIIWLRERQLAN